MLSHDSTMGTENYPTVRGSPDAFGNEFGLASSGDDSVGDLLADSASSMSSAQPMTLGVGDGSVSPSTHEFVASL
ncbi:hypothetical protein CEXT_52051 [Caerostris extrusa]|uniref:Uncharacterized protein n=1 Tax=Caerostris extrusa TaxID=172846 RepID=A0AAV4PSQ9_CAEEX|nr:hypothetical protein CEXT_52051 [Caerostris extrusa]